MGQSWTTSEVAAVVVGAIAALVINTMPAISGVLARDVGFQVVPLGIFGTAEIAGIAGGCLIAVFALHHIAPRSMVALGLLLLCLADAGSTAYAWDVGLIALRAVGGIGTGLVTAACSYVFSLKDQERNSAASMIGITALAAPTIILIPRLVNEFGWRAMFGSAALLVLLCFPLCRAIPSTVRLQEGLAQGSTRRASRLTMSLGLISVVLFNAGQFALWTYLERIGVAGGLSESQISNALSMCTVFGLVSAVGVLFLGERVTQIASVTSIVAINVIGTVATASSSPWLYTLGTWAFYFSVPPYLAALFGSIMRLAPSKRFATQFTLAVNLGAIGPALGGVLAAQYGLGSIRWLEMATAIASGLLLWIGFLSPWSQGLREQTAEAH